MFPKRTDGTKLKALSGCGAKRRLQEQTLKMIFGMHSRPNDECERTVSKHGPNDPCAARIATAQKLSYGRREKGSNE
jgi:hypothetical protein